MRERRPSLNKGSDISRERSRERLVVPDGIEDLVLLRCPDMDTKTWQILSREGTVWRDRTWKRE